MALTKEDLQAIASLIQQSEERTNHAIQQSEERTNHAIRQSEERTKNGIMSYIESHVEKEIHQLADGHKMLYEKMDREFKEIHAELDELKGTQIAHDFVITQRLKQG